MNWNQFVANWVINDYRAIIKKGEHDPDWPLINALLRAWYAGIAPSSVARKALREACR